MIIYYVQEGSYCRYARNILKEKYTTLTPNSGKKNIEDSKNVSISVACYAEYLNPQIEVQKPVTEINRNVKVIILNLIALSSRSGSISTVGT